MIEAYNLWFKYEPNGEYVLKNISFKFHGKAMLITGPNGSGKTTLLKILSGLLKPTKGVVLIEGNNLWEFKGKEGLSFRRNIVYVHEEPILFKGTVLDNIIYPLRIRGYGKREAIREAMNIIEVLDMGNLTYMNVKKLSTGQMKLVSLARAIVSKPKYLLLDEPLATLDRENMKHVLMVIKNHVLKRSNVIMASHRAVPIKFFDKTIELENGSIMKII